MPKSLLDELHISEDDVDSISGFARSIEGVEIGIMIREVEDGGGKISLRTSEHYNASELCKALGGGGHAAAAGATGSGWNHRRAACHFVAGWPSAGLSGSADMANGILIVDKPDGWSTQDVARSCGACSMKSASGTAGRSTRWQPACCPFSSGAPRAGSNFSSPRKKNTSPESGSARSRTPRTSRARFWKRTLFPRRARMCLPRFKNARRHRADASHVFRH